MTLNFVIKNTQDFFHHDKDLVQHQMLAEEKTPLVSIVVPLYNEENSIKDVLNRIPNNGQYEIIIVDDGSTDNSLKRINEVNKPIKVIQHKKNLGYGASILTGFKHAAGDIIITMDSDGQHNPEEIPNLISPIINNQADLVIGSRYLGESAYRVPFHTRLGEFGIKICLWTLYNQKVSNNQSGFRAFRKVDMKIFRNMKNMRFGLCTETLFRASSNNLRISEVPIVINSRTSGASKVKLIKLMGSIFLCILDYGLMKLKLKNPPLKRLVTKTEGSLTEEIEPLFLIKPTRIDKNTRLSRSISISKSTSVTQGKPKLSIIFPSYNGEKFLNRNLNSIRNLSNLHEIELVIIDNNSGDSSIDIIKSYKDDISINLIKKNTNLGFAKACNLCVSKAKGEFIFITNQDVIFPADFFNKIFPIYNMRNHIHDIIISPALVFEEGGSQSGIHYFGAKNHVLGFSYTPELGQELPKKKIVKLTDRCSGGTLFMKKDVFVRMGGFDNNLFMYYEDTDLSLRALRKGIKIYTTNDPYLIHQKHDWNFSDFRYYLLERNRYIVYFKNIDNIKRLLPYFLLSEVMLIFQSIISRKFRLRIRMYYELFSKRKLLKKLREKSKKEGALMPYQKLSRVLDSILMGNIKDSNFFNKFLNLFNYVLKRI